MDHIEKIKELGAELNAKLDAADKRIDALQEKTDKGETLSSDEIKSFKDGLDEQKAILTTIEENKETLTATQKHLDEMDAKLKGVRDGVANEGGLSGKIRKAFEEQKETFKSLGQNKGGQVQIVIPVDMSQKADMTVDADFGARVIPMDRVSAPIADPLASFQLRDVMTRGNTTSDNIEWYEETASVDGSDVKAEGAALGQSDSDFAVVTQKVEILGAHWRMTQRMMDDAEFVVSQMRTRGINKLLTKESQQIMYGTGSSPQLKGLDQHKTAWTDTLADTKVSEYDVLFAAATQARNSTTAEFNANIALINPTDWQNMALTKETAGMYVNQAFAMGGQTPTINGLRVINTPHVTADDFFVFDSSQTGLHFRKEIVFEFANTHSDDFTKLLVTARAYERVAFTVYRPNGVIGDTFSTALAKGSA